MLNINKEQISLQ